MTLEAHATAAGAGHPAETGPPPGALVNLAETIVIKEENVFVVCRRDGSLPSARRTRSASTPTTAASSPATSCASTASGRGCWSPPRRPARSRCTS